MLRWIGRILLLGLISFLGISYWKLEQISQPIKPEEILRWQVRELDTEQWEIQSISDPERKTIAWFRGNPRGLRCDTSILLTGVQQGKNLLDRSDDSKTLRRTTIHWVCRRKVWSARRMRSRRRTKRLRCRCTRTGIG